MTQAGGGGETFLDFPASKINKSAKQFRSSRVSKPMSAKTLQAILLTGLCSALSAVAQTSPVPPGDIFAPGVLPKYEQQMAAMTQAEREAFLERHPRIYARVQLGRIMLGRYAQMSPAEQQQFLTTHADLQKFVQNHPQAVARAQADAREAKPGVVDPGHPRVNEVNQRGENQQQRIAQGVAAGTLNPGQTAKIEGQEAKIQGQEAADMNGDHGHLTQAEQNKLNREENHVSTEIYDDKHGIAKPGNFDPGHPRVNEVTQREENQQQRISQGVASGKLTAGETAGLEKKEQKIQKEKVADMAGDKGHLTKAEQRQLNKQQNHVSHRIYQEKHPEKK